jgi:hypothetical protein
MAFYRFIVRDPINRVDGPGHDGAALDDDIDATLFAAGLIQRLTAERGTIPDAWLVEILRDQERVGILSFADGRRVVIDPHWGYELPYTEIRGSSVNTAEC